MLTIRYSDHFLRSARELPQLQQEKLAKLLEVIKEDPFHPQLHTKHLTGKLSGLFRITRDWRVIFQLFSPGEIQLIDVAHRKDIYR